LDLRRGSGRGSSQLRGPDFRSRPLERIPQQERRPMIIELLRPEKIVTGLTGDLPQILEQLFARSSFPDRVNEFRAALAGENAKLYTYIGDQIVVPHVRIEGLPGPEMILGIAREGIRLDGRSIKIFLFLATPAERSEEHLRLLQRLNSLLPAIKDDLVAERDGQSALAVLARGERESGKATYFNLTQEQVAFELQTNLERGLTTAEAEQRLSHYGPNLLRKIRRTPGYIKLLRNFFSFFAVLLWMAALLCFLPGVDMPQLGLAIFVVIVLNGLFAFLQEEKADRALETLQKLIAQKCRVLRDGRTTEIDAAVLVPGDVISLDAGDLVPADARLIEAFEVEVDNSSLTGESNPARCYKSDQPILLAGKFLWIELPNIVFAGTSVVGGRARAVVIGTGMHSEIGNIAGLTQAIRPEESPLQKQLRGTVVAISALAGGLGLIFLLVGWLLAGLNFFEAFVFFIGLFVANVPEGLLPTVTLALAMGVTRMARRNALVKSLPSVETLGCTTVICCDKTGTLTQNLMMVTELYVDGKRFQVSGVGYRPAGEFSFDGRPLSREQIAQWPALRRFLECAFICNNARLEKDGVEPPEENRATPSGVLRLASLAQDDPSTLRRNPERVASGPSRGVDYRVLGDPTEGALVTLAEKAGIRGTHLRIHLNPFESIRKKMSVVVQPEGGREKIAYAKGAPLETLERCEFVFTKGETRRLEDEERRKIQAENDRMASRGLRVLALAYRDDAELQQRSEYGAAEIEHRLVFLGFAAMSDPIRAEVSPAIRACHAAGIRIVMITGDYALTAASIGRQIGLGDGAPLASHSGAEISEMSDEKLRAILAEGETIFARVAPEHKLRIVSLLRDMGEVVAVTGDGVNDAPALKRADIGIAMGVRGNDVAKEAAHMILADDKFSSIVVAIEEGRAIFHNIRRFMAYIFNHNPLEMYPYIIWLLFPDVPLAMTVMGVLAVDVGTDLIPAMGLGIEPPERGIMEQPPRRRDQRLLSIGFILRNYFVQGTLVTLSCYATYLYMGWVLGVWKPGLGLSAMPSSPVGLRFSEASQSYLQTLTAYFFPAVTTQLANVHCQRSWKSSLFSRDFLNPLYRDQLLQSLAAWRPRPYTAKIRIDYRVAAFNTAEIGKAFAALLSSLLLLPFKLLLMVIAKIAVALERPVIVPLTGWLSRFMERHYIILNLLSNPLIDLGILFELALCYLFFYTPLSKIYFFAPVPWHVYLFAFHGAALLLIFEEVKKYYRRRGRPLEFLG
jgi:sodium/potassium-transporting ATPase subunit alpha